MNELGKFLHDRRVKLGLTLEEVGNAVGVSKSTVLKWESGNISNMRRDRIALLADVLKVPPVDLITGYRGAEDAELREYLEQLKNRSEMRMLFKLTKSATKEDVMKAVKIIEALKGESEDE